MIITFSKGDSTKIGSKQFSEIGSWAICFLTGTLPGEIFVFSIFWNFLVHLTDFRNTKPLCVASLDNQVGILCLKNFLHTPNFFNCSILVNVRLKEAFTWTLFTCKPKIAANSSYRLQLCIICSISRLLTQQT